MDAPDLARIRYVTRHFHSLQGLRFALACAPWMLWLAAQPYLVDSRLDMALQPLAVAIWLAVVFFGHWLAFWTRDYYSERFGVLRDENRLERMLPWTALFGAAALVDLLRIGTGGVSATLLVFALLGLWRAARGWPWRAHQLITAAVGGYAVLALPLPGPARNPNEYVGLVLLVVIATTAACALLDHRLLVNTLQPARREAVDTVPEELA